MATVRKPMGIFEATMIAEGDYEAAGYPDGVDNETVVDAYQMLIDTGMAWRLQGFFGRTAAAMIEAGHCHQAGE